jgi:hypothetical protein
MGVLGLSVQNVNTHARIAGQRRNSAAMIEQDDENKPRDAFSDPRLIPASQLEQWERTYWPRTLCVHEYYQNSCPHCAQQEYLTRVAMAEGDH